MQELNNKEEAREFCCAYCGYRSAASDFFRREKSGLLGIWRTFCMACQPYRATRLEFATYVNAGLMTAAGTLIVLFLPAGFAGFGSLFLFFGVFLSSRLLTIVVHEAGHAIAARLAGMKVVAISIGSGPVIMVRHWKGIRLEIHKFLLTRGAAASYHPGDQAGRAPEALMLLGGVMGNAVVLAVGILICSTYYTRHIADHLALVAIVFGILGSQAIAVAVNIFPRESRFRYGMVQSDGKRLLALAKKDEFVRGVMVKRLLLLGMLHLENGRYDKAVAHYESSWDFVVQNSVLFLSYIYCLAMSEGPHAVLACYFDRQRFFQSNKTEDPAHVALFDNNVAWAALTANDSNFLELADSLSGKAVELAPDFAPFQGTRGAVLVQMGDHEAGLSLLRLAIRGNGFIGGKALLAPWIAKAERAMGAGNLADEYCRLAQYLSQRIDPQLEIAYGA